MAQAFCDQAHHLRPKADDFAFLAALIDAFEMGTDYQHVAGDSRQAAKQGEDDSGKFAHGFSLGATL
jgi:hypothetical protein